MFYFPTLSIIASSVEFLDTSEFSSGLWWCGEGCPGSLGQYLTCLSSLPGPSAVLHRNLNPLVHALFLSLPQAGISLDLLKSRSAQRSSIDHPQKGGLFPVMDPEKGSSKSWKWTVDPLGREFENLRYLVYNLEGGVGDLGR